MHTLADAHGEDLAWVGVRQRGPPSKDACRACSGKVPEVGQAPPLSMQWKRQLSCPTSEATLVLQKHNTQRNKQIPVTASAKEPRSESASRLAVGMPALGPRKEPAIGALCRHRPRVQSGSC